MGLAGYLRERMVVGSNSILNFLSIISGFGLLITKNMPRYWEIMMMHLEHFSWEYWE